MGYPGYQGAAPYGYPPPVYIIPSCQGAGHQGVNNNHTPVDSPDSLHPHGTPPFSRGSTPISSVNMRSSGSPLPSDPVADRNAPDIEIIPWFSFLDRDQRSKDDDTRYSLFGAVLRRRGFLRISQLTSEFVKLTELEDWLGVERGIAILIMQYARMDLAAVRSGHWVFPGESDGP